MAKINCQKCGDEVGQDHDAAELACPFCSRIFCANCHEQSHEIDNDDLRGVVCLSDSAVAEPVPYDPAADVAF